MRHTTIKKWLAVALTCALALTATGLIKINNTAAKTDTATPSGADHDGIPENAEYIEGEAIVLYSSDVSKGMAARSLTSFCGGDVQIKSLYRFGEDGGNTWRAMGADSPRKNDRGFTVGVVESDEYDTKELVRKLENIKGVECACPNYVMHPVEVSDGSEDPYRKYQWALENTGRDGGTPGADIHKDSVKVTDTSEKVVAVIDSGIDYTHEDLKDVMWVNPCQDKLPGKYGYNFAYNSDDPMDDHYHGTHCAGIIAAKGKNGVGIEGVADGSGVKLMALKVGDARGSMPTDKILAAMEYVYRAVSLGVNVVATSNSYAGHADDNILKIEKKIIDSLGKLGVLSVVAAGNSGADLEQEKLAPACVESDYKICVAAMEADDTLAPYSNYNERYVNIAAPGTGIISTLSHAGFVPMCYDDETRERTCAYYEEFNYPAGVSASALGITLSDSEHMTMELLDNGGAGAADETSGCLRVDIDAEKDEDYRISMPRCITEASETPVYASIDARVEGARLGAKVKFLSTLYDESGGESEIDERYIGEFYPGGNSCWTRVDGVAAESTEEGNGCGLSIQLTADTPGTYTVYIDNAGISKSGLTDEDFGKYSFHKGTSMACPHVSGAVALLAGAYRDDTALARKNRLLGYARYSEELTGKVDSERILDLSGADNEAAELTGVRMNDNSEIIISGYFLDGTEVLLDGSEPEILSRDNNRIVLNGSGLQNKIVTVSLMKDGEPAAELKKHLLYGAPFDNTSSLDGLVTGNEPVLEGVFLPNEETGALYFADCDGAVFKGDTDFHSMKKIGGGYDRRDFSNRPGSLTGYAGGEANTDMTKPVLAGNHIYNVMTLDYYFEKYSLLIYFNESAGDTGQGCWKYLSDLPDVFTGAYGVRLAEFDNGLYCIGGVDGQSGEVKKDVWKYDIKTGEWSEQPSLPEPRAGCEVIRHGDKLIVALGGRTTSDGADGETDAMVSNLVFDGKKWTVSKAALNDKNSIQTLTLKNGNDFLYYKGYIEPTDSGFICLAREIDGMTSPVFYNIEQDVFRNADRSFDYPDHEILGTFLRGDAFYVAAVSEKLEKSKTAELFSIPVERFKKPAPSNPPSPTKAPGPTPAPSKTPAATPAPASPKKPAKAKLKKAVLTADKLTVAFKKVSGADIYEVQAAANKKMTKSKKKWRTKKLKIKNKKWTKKKCYVRVRAGKKKKNGGYVYGSWSKVKKV